VSYFRLVHAWIASTVNRYVAKYRAAGDTYGVNDIVSSAFCVLCICGLLVLGLAVTVSLLLPECFGDRLGENVVQAQLVVFWLGASLGIQVCFGAFGGVITGCHRWELQNIINSGWYAATVAGMIAALLLGRDLWVLALITFGGQVLAGVTRVIVAYSVYEGLRIRPSMVRWLTIRKVFVFGGKTLIPNVSQLLLNQTANILIVAHLGPGALALYARPRSLLRHMNTLANKMVFALTPTSSSLQSTGDIEGVRKLVIKSVRYSYYLILPMVLVLMVFGGPILQLWMGPRYTNGLIPMILAGGYLIPLAQTPIMMILTGLNAHGWAGMGLFVTSLISIGLTVLTLGYLRWGLVGTAVAVTLPLTIMNLTYLPFLICRRVRLNMVQYFLSVTVGPAIHILPFVICLIVARILFYTEPLIGLAWGGAVGGMILAVLYYRFVLPDRMKSYILRHVGLGEPVAR
jgi:O-antigen/teichoic acid export membrane protein